MLRKEERYWVQEEARRYKVRFGRNGRLGPRFRAESGSDRQRDLRIRKKVTKTITDLVWLAKTWPSDQQNKVFTEERVRQLVVSLLTFAHENESASDKVRRRERQYRIAAMLMEKGVAKCLEKVEAPYRESVENDALRLVLMLKQAAVSPDSGVSLAVKD